MKTRLSILALVMAASAGAQEVPDTLEVIEGPTNVVITEQGNLTRISARGSARSADYSYDYTAWSDNDSIQDEFSLRPDFPFDPSRAHRRASLVVLDYVMAGVCLPVDAPYGMKAGWEAAIPAAVGVRLQPWRKAPSLTFGLGLSSRIMYVGKGMRVAQNGNDISIVQSPEGVTPRNSHIQTLSLTIPVMLKQRLWKDLSFSLGTIVNLNVYASADASWKEDNKTVKVDYRGISQRFVTADLLGVVSWDDLGVFVKYSPQTLFSGSEGPRFKALSVGLCVNF